MLQQCSKALEMDPNFYYAYFFRGVQMNAGDWDAAIADYEKARSLAHTPWMIGALGGAHARAGKSQETGNLFRDLEVLSTQRYVTSNAQAQILIGLGRKDRAFEWLNKMYEERSMFVTFLKMEPLYDPLRSDPRFAELLKKVRVNP